MSVVEIPLTRGLVSLVDVQDYVLYGHLNWHADSRPYAGHNISRRHGKGMQFLHQLILPAPPGMSVDHINRNTLDNRRCNLRLCTHQQNCWNRGPYSGRKYKGVIERYGRFNARIVPNRKPISLGWFDNPEDAARKYDKAATELYGEFAWLNFPVNDD